MEIEFEKYFEKFDKDHNGTIDLYEFIEGMNTLCPGFSEKTSRSLFRMVDKDQSQDLTLSEFTSAIRFMETQVNSNNTFIILFNRCDSDKDGLLNYNEFSCIWKSIDPTLDNSLIVEFFHHADRDNNGYIDLNEYLQVASEIEQQFTSD